MSELVAGIATSEAEGGSSANDCAKQRSVETESIAAASAIADAKKRLLMVLLLEKDGPPQGHNAHERSKL
jgi:hypothetical protein